MHLHKCINSKFLDLTIHSSNNSFANFIIALITFAVAATISAINYSFISIHVSTWFCHCNASFRYHKVHCIYTCMWRYIVLLLICRMSSMSFLCQSSHTNFKSGNNSQNWFIFWNSNSASSIMWHASTYFNFSTLCIIWPTLIIFLLHTFIKSLFILKPFFFYSLFLLLIVQILVLYSE